MQSLGEPLASFLPLDLLRRIHGSGRERPAAVEFPAAVLFVDVSRYTSLVEQLAWRGQDGLERIPDLLGRAHAQCVETVYELGGEVLQLAGDAVLAYWAADVIGLDRAVSAAVHCARDICAGRRVDADVAETVPTVHAGIGAGRLWAAALGGQPTWSLLVGGVAVKDAAAAVGTAGPGHYVVSPSAAFEGVNPTDNRSYQPPPLAPNPPFDWLLGFLPRELQADHVRHAPQRAPEPNLGFDALAEVRPITVVFARIVGLDDATDTLARYQTLWVALQEDLRRHDGPAGELLFDDKGLVFIAVFGAFGRFHRDDASRALEASRAMSSTTSRLGLKASIGVATGEALFRVVGSARRRQLMVLGAPMNRAARLMTSAAQGILCDAPTERTSRRRFGFQEMGTLQLDGLGDAAAVFRPLGARTPTFTRASLIGREPELVTLRRAFDEASDGFRRVVIVSGEPGIGKTHLIETFGDGLPQSAVALARVERDDRRTVLQPWRRVLASLLRLDSTTDGPQLLSELIARFSNDPAIVGRLPLLDGMLGVQMFQTDGTRHLDGANRADAIMRLLGDVIGALAPRPLVVILEDSQWLDSASWRLFDWVLSSISSLLVVLSVRPEEAPEALSAMRRRAESTAMSKTGTDGGDPHFCRIIDLEELSDSAICEIVGRTLGSVPPHEDVARRIADLAGGNPFFAEEIALTLKSEGLIAVRDGSWRTLRSLDALHYFEGVERVIRERVDTLDPFAQSVLKAAAVIGRSFTERSLVPLLRHEMTAAALASALDSLRAAHLVRRVGEPGQYVFRHDQTRDVVYSSIPGDVRQRLHQSLAEWLEVSRPADTSAELGVLVQHFHAAGNRDQAVRYGELAAARALQTGAFREVESFLDICLSYEPREPWTAEQRLQAVRWRRQLGETYYGLGNIKAQSSSVRRALTLAGHPVPDSALALARRLLGGTLRLTVQQLLPRAVGRGPATSAVAWEREVARCLSQAAVVDYFELRIVRAFCHALDAVTHADRAGLSIEAILASAQVACAFGILGRHRLSTHFMSRAEQGAIALGDPAAHAQVCYLDSLWRVGHCDWDAVDRRLDQSQQLCLAAGDQLSWCNAQAIRFWSLYYRADQGALERTAHGLLSRAQNSGNLQQEIWALRCKSLCVLQSESPREAVEILRLITSELPGSADLAEQVASTGALALALSRAGQHAESVEAAVETLRLLREMPRPTVHSTLPGISGVAEVLMRGREAGLAREYAQWPRWERQILRELDRYRRVFPVGVPQHGLWSGVARWLDGDRDAAVAKWRKALAVARRQSLRRDVTILTAELRRCDAQAP
jgi:class 3 adenylate cyclase